MASKDEKAPEPVLPIDIPFNKLADWLIQRNMGSSEWRTQLKCMRDKVKSVLSTLPDVSGMEELKKNSALDYFTCQKILSLLQSNVETNQKNWFGGYKSVHMKEWATVIGEYEKDGLFLMEAASVLVQNVQYEIPHLRNSMSKMAQQINDLTRKEGECHRLATENKLKYKQSCDELGIEGLDVESELQERCKILPTIFTECAEKIRGDDTRKAAQYYRDFAKFVLGDKATALNLLPCLQEVIDAPSIDFADEEPSSSLVGDAEVLPSAGIDWGLDLNAAAEAGTTAASTNGAIDWGVEASAEPCDGEIDWGISTGDQDNGGNDGGIDWDIEAVDDAAAGADDGNGEGIDWDMTALDDGAGITMEAEGCDGNVNVFEDPERRADLVADLVELCSFLRQRLQEQEDKTFKAVRVEFIGDPSASLLQQWLLNCESALSVLDKQSTQHLILVKSSGRYLQRLAKGLRRKKEVADHLVKSAEDSKKRQQDLSDSIAKTKPEIVSLSNRTKTLQKNVEEAVAKLLKGNPVHLTGDINSI